MSSDNSKCIEIIQNVSECTHYNSNLDFLHDIRSAISRSTLLLSSPNYSSARSSIKIGYTAHSLVYSYRLYGGLRVRSLFHLRLDTPSNASAAEEYCMYSHLTHYILLHLEC